MTEAPPTHEQAEAAQKERGLDRLIGFTDAVVAIALTLIVLPLVDLAADPKVVSTAQFFHSGGDRLAAGGLSFVVIALFWREHHAEMERAGRNSRLLLNLNLLWMAGIVFLPVPTALLFTTRGNDLLGADVYIAAMLVTMVSMRFIQMEVAWHCTAEGLGPLPGWRLGVEWIPVALMVVALGLAAAGLGTRALWLLVLAFPAQVLVERLHAAWSRGHARS